MNRVCVMRAAALAGLALFVCSCSQVERGLNRIGVWGPQTVSLPPSVDGTSKVTAADSAAPAKSLTQSSEGTGETDVAALQPTPQPEIQRGSGDLIKRSAALPPRPVDPAPSGGTFSFNFVDTDVREVVSAVLGKMLKTNYVMDPKIQGVITLQTTKPIEMRKVLPTLESALRLSGVAIVKSDSVYRVVPIDSAMRGEVVPRLRPSAQTAPDGFGVQIVPLSYVPAGEMEKILEPFAPKGAIVRVDPERNLLLLAGTHNERLSMNDIIDIFDVDWFRGMSIALVPLRFSEATAVAEDVSKVFSETSDGGSDGMVRFVPIERTNSVLAISPRATYIDRAKDWIEKFDIGNPAKDRRLYVYPVQNGLAVDLAVLLTQIFGGTVERNTEGAQGQLAPGLKPTQLRSAGYGSSQTGQNRPGSSLTRELSGRSAFQQRRPGQPTAVPAPVVEQVAPEAAPAYAPSPIHAAASPTTASGLSLSEESDIRIIANDVKNSLVILATPSQFREIQAALKQLDTTPLQVLIEATIAEVTLDDKLKYGVKWFFDTANTQITLSDVASGAVNSAFPGFSVLFSSGSDVRVVLDALDSVTDVNVVSTPQLMVLDNRTAELLVGDQVPVATQSSVSSINPDAPIVNSIEFRDTGVVLRVTPRVNASGLVNLEIEQEVSDVVPTTTSGIDSPTIRQRRIQSHVAVQSGQSVALGGLIRDRRTNKTDGVPFLSRVPVMGALFGTQENAAEKTELLVLITPKVIRDQEEAAEMTTELRNRIRSFAPKPGEPKRP